MFSLKCVAALAVASACGSETAVPSMAPGGSGDTAPDFVNPDEGSGSGRTRSAHERDAIPAWQAVVDRARYLERRGDTGVVQGVVCPAAAPFTWLVDETEGSGSLAIRVLLPPGASAAPGDRVVVVGAWSLDALREWYWRASVVTVLPALASVQSRDFKPSAPPGTSGCAENAGEACDTPCGGVDGPISHAVADGDMPPDARPISLAKQGEHAYFAVVGNPPILDGDGWLVADTPHDPPSALINMPGEQASLGGQDFRSHAERWSLRRGETYWVRIGHIRRRRADKLATANARTPPVAVSRSAIQSVR